MASDESPDKLAQINIGTKISSKTTAYEVQSILGQGTFGTVAKCTKMSDMQTVALKIMKNEESLAYQSMEEVRTKRLCLQQIFKSLFPSSVCEKNQQLL